MINTRLDQLIREKAAEWQRDITYANVKEATGISESTLARLKLNRAKGIQWSVLDSLCTFFQCAVGDILEHIPDGNEAPK